jgi:thiamine-phosphate pyrophosphorylase
MKKEIYQIIDVNINRIREGLRVLEDFSRFILKDRKKTEEIKKIRHKLKVISKKFGDFFLLTFRDAEKDFGKEIFLPSEYKRKNYSDLLTSNFKRIQEALRTLEEYSKFVNLEISNQIKKIRFEVYTLEKEIGEKIFFKKELSGLYVIIDKKIAPSLKITEEIIKAGAKIIQLRCKNTPVREFLKDAKILRKLTKEKGAIFIINDSLEIAQAVDAEGVHLGEEDIPLDIARKILGPEKIIGASVSSVSLAKRAEIQKADYLGVGSIFKTSTKEDAGNPVGCKIIKKIKEKVSIPVFAIGGINRDNIEEVLKSGADGVCISSAILLAKNPAEETKKIIRIIQKNLFFKNH